MLEQQANKFSEMETFVYVVDLGSFSLAAKRLDKTPSSISKLISRLEARLTTKLFNRSTRELQLTEEGHIFYEKCLYILSNLEEAERSVTKSKIPIGNLRISVNIPYGQHFILPLIPKFITKYPDITIDITLTDQVINLISEYTDVAIRAGPMKDSSLVARKLCETNFVIVASNDYLEINGTPSSPEDLKRHSLLRFNFKRLQEDWLFQKNKRKIVIKPKGNIQVSDGESMRQLALNGAGIARLSNVHVHDDIQSGRLIPLLEDYNPHDTESLYAVYVGDSSYLPARIKVFLDFLSDAIKI